MWKNIVQPGRPQMTIQRMRIARWIPKATKTHSEHVILNAYPLQQRLHERASMLRYRPTYTTCLVHNCYAKAPKKYKFCQVLYVRRFIVIFSTDTSRLT